MEGVLGYIEVELDGRFKSVRTQETNLGKCELDFNRSTKIRLNN